MSLQRIAVSLVATSLLGLAVGCQGGGGASATPPKAVLVSSGQGTSTLYVPSGEGAAVLASSKGEHCAACEADAATYFKSGQLAPKCAVCGAPRTVLTGTN